MSQEIANKIKEVYPVGSRSDSFGETYPVREHAASNGAGIKCKKCGDEILSITHGNLNLCKCGAISVDGSKELVRVIGKPEDYEEIQK